MANPKKKKADKKSAKGEESTNDSTDDETPDYLTTDKFEKLLQKHLQPIQEALNQSLIKVQADIDEIKAIAANALRLAENSSKLAEENKNAIQQLTSENTHLKQQIRQALEQNLNLEERIENRTNRQLRKTIVFKGIPESEDSKESWNETEELLSKKIADICNMSLQQASKMIERCHRSNPNPNYKGSAPRPIFAAFYDWKDSEFTKMEFRKNNIDNPSCRIYAEQKFGPKTTSHRNLAMVLRK